MTKRFSLFSCTIALGFLAGCATSPQPVAKPPASPTVPVVVAPPAPVGTATIKGSEESSLLLDNFTAFVSAIDGKVVAEGRTGWAIAREIPAGHRVLTVEFNRGVFSASADIALEAVDHAAYQLKFKTDAELFGHNSFCDFWIVDSGTGQAVTLVKKAPVVKKE